MKGRFSHNNKLISVFGTSNILAAICALKWSALNRGSEDSNGQVVLIVSHPGMPDSVLLDIGKIVDRIISSLGWEKAILILKEQRDFVNNPKVRNSRILREFRRIIDLDEVSEFYFAHDVVGNIPELAMNAFPRAKRITFGDALGSIYDKRYHLQLASGETVQRGIRGKWNIKRKVMDVKNNLLNRINGTLTEYHADKAILILPMDQTGRCLDSVELSIVPKRLVLDVIRECNVGIPELVQYCKKIISTTLEPRYLFLLENLADGGFATIEAEVDMYEEMINQNVLKGSTILIKPHPFSVLPVDELLCKRLQGNYSVLNISSEFSRYPIELWTELVENCQILTMSYSAISLRYLYERDTKYVMNLSLIEKFIPSKYWDSYKNAHDLYIGQLDSLRNWDGHSILWKGSI